MRKLQALTKALRAADVSDDTLHSYVDQGELLPITKDLGHGYQVGIFKYQAVIQIDRYKGGANELLSFLTAWLQMNDPQREDQGLKDPDVDTELNDNDTAFVDIGIDFEEPLKIVPDENGPIDYLGGKYRVADVPIDVAEELDSMEGGANAK